MPSTVGEPPRTWWSLAKSPSGKDLRQEFVKEKQARRPSANVKSSGLNFTSFASAIGFKSKKPHPSLAIQEPPSPLLATFSSPNSPLSDTTRPTSKSASSTRTRVDSLEPRTPVDFQKRGSLLTLSDADPFAGRPIIATHTPTDPNRLSVYSNPSVTEFVPKKCDPPTFNRVSYASTSSNSHHLGAENATVGVVVPSKGIPEVKKLHTKRSAGSLQAKRPEHLIRQPSTTASTASSPPTNGALPETAPLRPKLRARGLTDSGAPQRSGFFVEERNHVGKLSPQSSSDLKPSETMTSPRVIVRQPSTTRMQAPPPSAPPNQSLPPPPPSPVDEVGPTRRLVSKTGSTSSAISFASSMSMANDMFAVPFVFESEKRSSQPSLFSSDAREQRPESTMLPSRESKSSFSSPRTLKKALSHSSLKRSLSPAASRPKTPPEAPTDKRKVRNFHHPRLPIPPIPLSLRPSTSSGAPTSPPPDSTSPDQGKSSGGRKRLFSNSSSHSRPSTSQCIPANTTEDDTLSLFSLRSDNESHFSPYKPWSTTTHYPKPTSSFWDEGIPETVPSSPIRHAESITQAILSPDELAKLEASVDGSGTSVYTRSRGFSLLSASTMTSELDLESEAAPVGLSPPPSARPSLRQASVRMSASSAVSKKSARSLGSSRPSTADPLPSRSGVIREDKFALADIKQQPPKSSASSQVTMRSPSPPVVASLPPPPRPRLRSLASLTRTPSSVSTQTQVSFASSSVTTKPELSSPGTSAVGVRPPSIRKSGRAPVRLRTSVEKNMHRRSIMRKPSFLEISDDDDDDDHPFGVQYSRDAAMLGSTFLDERAEPSSGVGGGSFLDLARESFDTMRTDL